MIVFAQAPQALLRLVIGGFTRLFDHPGTQTVSALRSQCCMTTDQPQGNPDTIVGLCLIAGVLAQEKLEIMIQLANDRNIDQVLLEFKEYATEVDVDFVRKV